jgi:hypothetical protein
MNLDQLALKLDGKAITLGEVLAASYIGGWLKPLKQRIADDLSCTALGADRNLEVTADQIQRALNRWRTERDLIAADEMQRWLDWIGLDLGIMAEHLERQILREQLEDELAEARRRFPQEPAPLLDLAASEAVLGDEMHELTGDFAIRAVVPEPEQLEDRRGDALRQIFGALGVEGLDALQAQMEMFGVSMERAEWLLNIEVLFMLYREDYVTKSMPPKALKEMFADLTKYEVITAAFPSEDIAREVLCCVQEDGEPFARVATQAEAECRTESVYGSQIQSVPFGSRFFIAQPGDLFGPEPAGEEFLLGQLVARSEPDINDPDVVLRITVRIIEKSLRRTMSERVFLPPNVYHTG